MSEELFATSDIEERREQYKKLPVFTSRNILPSPSTLEGKREFSRHCVEILKSIPENPGWLQETRRKHFTDDSYDFVMQELGRIDDEEHTTDEILRMFDDDAAELVYWRMMDIASEKFPDLRLWRGGNYDPEGLFRKNAAVTTSLRDALKFVTSGYAAEERQLPCLMEIPVSTVVKVCRENKSNTIMTIFEHRYDPVESVEVVTDFPQEDLKLIKFYRMPFKDGESNDEYLNMMKDIAKDCGVLERK